MRKGIEKKYSNFTVFWKRVASFVLQTTCSDSQMLVYSWKIYKSSCCEMPLLECY